jgi:hypothetical protein
VACSNREGTLRSFTMQQECDRGLDVCCQVHAHNSLMLRP